MNGVSRERRSKSDSGSGTPTRPATAGRWTIAFVLPPIAMSTRMAFSNASRVRIRLGRRSSATISTTRRPVASASARRRESGAGIAALPGSVIPSDSAIEAIVEAVPMTMQWPAEREKQLSSSHQVSSSSRPARNSSQ